ncbi:putative peptide modification system cyclase [Lysobacter koreensis]|uniref:Peptide modification system cyclase n=1 Tax=Lysobacter koreensis TaxID=266122 RepID=A0ABW2YN56_9GAMM
MNDLSQHSSDAPQLRTLLLTDLCDSTSLVERLGDTVAAELFREHDRLVLQLQQQWRGRLIDRSDGLLLLFERPIDGLGFALDYGHGLRALGKAHQQTLLTRAGLHVGEVLTWRNSDEAVRVGAKPLEVEGLAKPTAARLMSMARPGQILLSAVAEPLAHRAARELGERGLGLTWKSHGRWHFKGVPNSQEVFEVGEPGIAPLRAPPSSPKAWRDIPLWRRPAALAAEVALLAGIGIGAWFVTRPQPAIAFNQRDWVVVADLRNLTGDQLLDDSLEQAFRISLEQSRHVNVLSDLKTRDTLSRMQLKPGTVLDRAIASEVAVRDGARAVILPTVSEVGGRVRVSAEVIDPHTQTTVYAESADGTGAVSALDSIDTVTAALRGKLGEALKSIEKDSAPLPRVTTKNLDALRAYALGVQAYSKADTQQALRYFQHAIELDPQFALAYLGIMRTYVAVPDAANAKHYLQRAEALRSHLPLRDALYLDAWVAELGPKPSLHAPEKWKLLSGVYPDYHAGSANYAWAAFTAGRYQESMKSALLATAAQNPLRGHAVDQVGRAQLAQEQYAAALLSFKQAGAAQQRRASRQQAAALAATRRFTEADAVLKALPQDVPSGYLERVAIPLDQGRWDQALRNAVSVKAKVSRKNFLLRDVTDLVELSVRALRDPGNLKSQAYLDVIYAALDGVDLQGAADVSDRVYVALTATYLAQRAGRGDVADKAMQKLAKQVAESGDPRLAQMLQIIRAGQLRLAGNAPAAVAQLERLMDGSELFQAHVALRDALRAAGRYDEALREDRWLAARRGLAYVELTGAQAQQAINVADTTLARLDAAEVLQKLGRIGEARLEAEAFSRAWPQAGLPDYLRDRAFSILPATKQ